METSVRDMYESLLEMERTLIQGRSQTKKVKLSSIMALDKRASAKIVSNKSKHGEIG